MLKMLDHKIDLNFKTIFNMVFHLLIHIPKDVNLTAVKVNVLCVAR